MNMNIFQFPNREKLLAARLVVVLFTNKSDDESIMIILHEMTWSGFETASLFTEIATL